MVVNSISSPPPRLAVPLGLRACPLQHGSSAVIRPPIRLSHNSSTARISPMIVCAVRRLFRLIVELRLPQRIERRPRHGLASRRCSVAATLNSRHASRKSQRSAPDHPHFGERPCRPSGKLIAILFFQSRSPVFFCDFGFFSPRLLTILSDCSILTGSFRSSAVPVVLECGLFYEVAKQHSYNSAYDVCFSY